MKGWNKIVVVFAVLLAAFLCKNLLAGQVGQPSPVDNLNSPDSSGIRNDIMTSGDACPTREELITKTRTLQMPFIANNGQVDEQVQFYAKTFGGTVFVTKEGEIVYALPSGRDVPAGASQESEACRDALHASLYHRGRGTERQGSKGAEEQGRKAVFGCHGQAPLVRADAEFVYSPLLRADNADCPPERVLTNALLAVYLPGLQKETTRRVVSTPTPSTNNPGVLPANNNPHSAIQNPQSPIRGVALKETIVGAKIGGITGEQPAVTTVNYFTGNDKSKWKTNVPTYNMVNLGEVYKGIELSLKAYGDNVEKLFCVKPGANPELIKVQLDGSKSLRVNQEGQLEADTELGLVKFTRPIAYQEIDGKRVEVACEYTIADCGVQSAEYKTNPQSTTSDSPIPHSEFRTPHSEYSFTVASYDKTKDLIIDPLLASTYLGGSDSEMSYSIALDTSGNVYVTGYTYSPDFPTTSGAYDTSFNGGNYDVFVSKLDGNLSAHVECTAESITSAPNKLTIRKNGNGDVTITVTGAGGCLVEGVTVTATIKGKGKRLIDVSPGSQETNANGQAVFSISAKGKKGTAVLQFQANGLNKVATVQVKVR